MRISCDPAKRLTTLHKRGLDFEDAREVFEGRTLRFTDERRDYGEARTISVGLLRGRLVVIVWTERDDERRIISMRKANEREQAKYRQRLEEG